MQSPRIPAPGSRQSNHLLGVYMLAVWGTMEGANPLGSGSVPGEKSGLQGEAE